MILFSNWNCEYFSCIVVIRNALHLTYLSQSKQLILIREAIFDRFYVRGNCIRQQVYSQSRLDGRWTMICIQERYLRSNRIALLTIGLWPHQQSLNLIRLLLVLFLGVLISYITFQVYKYSHVMLYDTLSYERCRRI